MTKLTSASEDNLTVMPTRHVSEYFGHDKRGRKDEWCLIVVHHTGIGGRKEISPSLWEKLGKNISAYLGKKDSNYVSAHYLITRSGERVKIIDPKAHVAFHAGKSSFWNSVKRKWVSGCNEFAIGIEMLGDGNLHKYSDEQYAELATLIKELRVEFKNIPPNGIVGHEMVSPGRKVDPGVYFDWDKLFKLIYKAK